MKKYDLLISELKVCLEKRSSRVLDQSLFEIHEKTLNVKTSQENLSISQVQGSFKRTVTPHLVEPLEIEYSLDDVQFSEESAMETEILKLIEKNLQQLAETKIYIEFPELLNLLNKFIKNNSEIDSYYLLPFRQKKEFQKLYYHLKKCAQESLASGKNYDLSKEESDILNKFCYFAQEYVVDCA